MPRLENWSVGTSTNIDPYTAPELINRYLYGKVYGSPKFKDGTDIMTSIIISSEGRVVKTYSGSKYTLGEPHSDYVKYLKDTGYGEIDSENPVIIK